MKKIAGIIMPYFGLFKPSINMFLESCRRNPEIDWYFFTDNPKPDNLPENVKWEVTELRNIERLAKQKISDKVCINRAYKLCDYKPIYGYLFEDYLKGYEYWGYGDVDVVVGRVFPFLQKIEYQRFDQINTSGQFTFLRNNDQMRMLWNRDIEGTLRAVDVLSEDEYCVFDEAHFLQKGKYGGVNYYYLNFIADIDFIYRRMRLSDSATAALVQRTSVSDEKIQISNYRQQVFLVREGRLFRYYIDHNNMGRDEFAAIHFRREAPIFVSDIQTSSFVISRDGFFDINSDRLEEIDYINWLIKKYNSQGNRLTEAMMYQIVRMIYQNRLVRFIYNEYRKIRYGN